MQTFKVPRSSSDLPYQVNRLRTDINDILRKFGTEKILEKKLSTKTFNYEFDLSGLRVGGQRKSVQKFRDIIFKAIKKQVPYLEYTKDGEMLQNSTATNAVMIKLVSPWITVTQTPSETINSIQNGTHYVKSLIRYLAFLRHKCIRRGIPLDFPMSSVFEIHPEDLARYSLWSSVYQEESITFKVRVRSTINVKLVTYEYSPYVDWVHAGNVLGTRPDLEHIKSYADYEAHISNVETARLRYLDQRNWTASDMNSRNRLGSYPGTEKYACPEKLFLILDEIQQVAKTLSRKTSYDTAAFNIGSGEAS